MLLALLVNVAVFAWPTSRILTENEAKIFVKNVGQEDIIVFSEEGGVKTFKTWQIFPIWIERITQTEESGVLSQSYAIKLRQPFYLKEREAVLESPTEITRTSAQTIM
jgi:hypothetical protein